MRERFERHRPRFPAIVWVILGLGLLLRLAVMVFYTPTVFNFYGGDSTRYMRLDFTGYHGLFDDNAMPAGYPTFLAALRELWAWLPLTVLLQHLLGLVTAALLYAAVVRAGAPRWAALLPLVVVAFSGDQLFLEHGIFTEALWMPLLALGLYLATRALADPRAQRWLIAAGVVLAVSATVRHVSQILPVLVAVWAALALPGGRGERLRHAAAVLLPAIVVIGAYFVVAKPIAGGYSGLTENQGFSLYGRVAQFADCRKFTPPSGTESLCVQTPPDRRYGPFYWTFGPDSPLRTFSTPDPDDFQAKLSEFGRTAILNQPLDYLKAAAKDFARFFAPGLGPTRPWSGSESTSMSFESEIPAQQGQSLEELADQYDEEYSGVGDGEASEASRTLFGGYQELFRVEGLLMLVLIVLGFVGALLQRGPPRAGAALFLLSGLALLAFPAAFSSYDVRYTVQPINLFAAAAAFGLAALATRADARRRLRPATPETSPS